MVFLPRKERKGRRVSLFVSVRLSPIYIGPSSPDLRLSTTKSVSLCAPPSTILSLLHPPFPSRRGTRRVPTSKDFSQRNLAATKLDFDLTYPLHSSLALCIRPSLLLSSLLLLFSFFSSFPSFQLSPHSSNFLFSTLSSFSFSSSLHSSNFSFPTLYLLPSFYPLFSRFSFPSFLLLSLHAFLLHCIRQISYILPFTLFYSFSFAFFFFPFIPVALSFSRRFTYFSFQLPLFSLHSFPPRFTFHPFPRRFPSSLPSPNFSSPTLYFSLPFHPLSPIVFLSLRSLLSLSLSTSTLFFLPRIFHPPRSNQLFFFLALILPFNPFRSPDLSASFIAYAADPWTRCDRAKEQADWRKKGGARFG